MSKIKPMELIARMSGKVCGHSNTYFAYRNGTHYTGTICNPCTKEPTEKQMEVRRRFAQIYLEMKQLTEEEKTMYEIEFKNQKKVQNPQRIYLRRTLQTNRTRKRITTKNT